MVFEGKGVFDANFGKIDTTRGKAKIHNETLDEALLIGLDENCQIGERGSFYYDGENRPLVVQTWIGTTVSEQVRVAGATITFVRENKTYRGRLKRQSQLFNFRRIY